MKGHPAATLTRCSGKTLDRPVGRVFGSPSHGHPVDVPWRSSLARLHHRPSWSLGDNRRVAGLLGAGWLPWLRWLDGMVGLPGAGWQRCDDDRDVDPGPGGIWQRSRTLRSRSYSFEKKRDGVSAGNVSGSVQRQRTIGHTEMALGTQTMTVAVEGQRVSCRTFFVLL